MAPGIMDTKQYSPTPCIIPAPMEMRLSFASDTAAFVLAANSAVKYDLKAEGDNGAKEAAEFLAAALRRGTGFALPVCPATSEEGSEAEAPGNTAKDVFFSLAEKNTPLPAEGYQLDVNARRVHIRAADAAGFFYGAQTFRQLLPPEAAFTNGSPGSDKTIFQIPPVTITDAPRYQWRGLMLDVSRHFFSKKQVMRLLELMALHKLNTFHFHLTDGDGWRLEIKRFPRLTDIGARGERGNPAAPARFFTQEDIREILDHARALHIRVVPEIEMPDHCDAAIRAHPEIACHPNRNVGMCCPGKDATLRFYEGVLDEVCELFDSPFVHIGGDECRKTEWLTCPDCAARMKANLLQNYSELQNWFTRHFINYLAAKGRRALGWDDILDGAEGKEGIPGAVVMSWRGLMGGPAAAKAGHDVVLSPLEYCYFDIAQFANVDDGHGYPPESFNYKHTVSLRAIHAADPSSGVPDGLRHHVLGVQANMWTEFCATEEDLDWKLFPRLCALAEIAWTPRGGNAGRDHGEFLRRLEDHRVRLLRLGINAAPLAWPSNTFLRHR